jgi:hypothetical protein
MTELYDALNRVVGSLSENLRPKTMSRKFVQTQYQASFKVRLPDASSL